MISKNKRGAMEMSVGTIVTIVLLMGVLVLGIFLIQKIFRTGTNAIDTIDSEVQNQINKLFSEEGKKIAIYPTSRQITLKKGDDPKGFAFSVRNPDVVSHDFEYEILAQDVTGCGSLTEDEATSWLRPKQGELTIGPGSTPSLAELVVFVLPESAPPCTITYRVQVTDNENFEEGGSIFVTIK